MRKQWMTMIGTLSLITCTVRAQQIVRVDAASSCTTGGSCSGCGATWATAYLNLKEAIDCALVPAQVWVAAGTYSVTQTISLRDDVAVYGGFNKTETTVAQSDSTANPTIVDGNDTTPCFRSTGSTSSALLRGLKVTRGYANAFFEGGGLTLLNSNATIVNCVFENNFTPVAGAAAVIDRGGAPAFVNCVFRNNTHRYGPNGELTIGEGNDILAAGAVFIGHGTTPTLTNCLFDGNHADEGGAVFVDEYARPKLVNCTFVNNKATLYDGGAISFGWGIEIRNSIFWNNESEGWGSQIFVDWWGGPIVISHSDVQGGWAGQGNIATDPMFKDAPNGDYRIKVTSPCKNTGTDAMLPNDVGNLDWDTDTTEVLPKDLKMCARKNGTVDIGAYEFHPACTPGSGAN